MLLYERALRVPWIVRGPGIVAGDASTAVGGERRSICCPPLLDLLGVELATRRRPRGRSWAWQRSRARQRGRARRDARARPLQRDADAVPLLRLGAAPRLAPRRLEADRRAFSRALRHPIAIPASCTTGSRDEKAIARQLGAELQAIAAARSRDAAPAPTRRRRGREAAQPGLSHHRASHAAPARSRPQVDDGASTVVGEAQEALLRGDPERR